MKLIVGLGNPGSEYKNSRHNIGFDLIELLAWRWSVEMSRKKFHALCGEGTHAGERVTMLKPQRFMNRSGLSVAEAVAFFKLPLTDVLVVVDDMALELGQLRIRLRGSAGGHNGLKDIIAQLGSDDFARLRVGIGSARHGDAIDHVLGNFDSTERSVIDETLHRAAQAVECWMTDGIEKVMTRFNARNSKEQDER